MRWEQPDDRHGRTAVFLLVAAILVAAALAIALVAGAASQSSQPSGDVVVRGVGVTDGTSPVTTLSVPPIPLETTVDEGAAANVLDLAPGRWPGTAVPGAYGDLVIAGHRSTPTGTFERVGELTPGDPIVVGDRTGSYTRLVSTPRVPGT